MSTEETWDPSTSAERKKRKHRQLCFLNNGEDSNPRLPIGPPLQFQRVQSSCQRDCLTGDWVSVGARLMPCEKMFSLQKMHFCHSKKMKWMTETRQSKKTQKKYSRIFKLCFNAASWTFFAFSSDLPNGPFKKKSFQSKHGSSRCDVHLYSMNSLSMSSFERAVQIEPFPRSYKFQKSSESIRIKNYWNTSWRICTIQSLK
jgi:hypothetical protein